MRLSRSSVFNRIPIIAQDCLPVVAQWIDGELPDQHLDDILQEDSAGWKVKVAEVRLLTREL